MFVTQTDTQSQTLVKGSRKFSPSEVRKTLKNFLEKFFGGDWNLKIAEKSIGSEAWDYYGNIMIHL